MIDQYTPAAGGIPGLEYDHTTKVLRFSGGVQVGGGAGLLDLAQMALTPWQGYGAMKHVSVKLDGSGDFTDIQAAINSITDASPGNQYVVDVYDDITVTAVTALCYRSNVNVKLGNITTLTDTAALFFTKPYVAVRGIGAQRKISLVMPANLSAASYQWIQPIFVAGSNLLESLYISVKGGRYAVHQDSGKGLTSPDANSYSIYRNLTMEHFGNLVADGYPAGAWSSVCAQANGTASGQRQLFDGVKWLSPFATPFYFHSNTAFAEASEHEFRNCQIVRKGVGTLSAYNPNYVDMGSGRRAKIIIAGCNFTKFAVMGGIYSNETDSVAANIAANGGATLYGSGNSRTALAEEYIDSLRISSLVNGAVVTVTGGTAYNDIYGGDLVKYAPGVNSGGRVWGKIRIVEPNLAVGASRVFSLPYRLGNCAANPKTLTLTVGATPYTITFDQNYMTADGSPYAWNTTPAISAATILASINAVAPSAFVVATHSPIRLQTFQDTSEVGYNATTSVIALGSAVKRDTAGTGCWMLCGVGDFAEGIACERIGPGETGVVAYIDKISVQNFLIGIYFDVAIGVMYKCAAAGAFATTAVAAEASIIAIDPAYFTGYRA